MFYSQGDIVLVPFPYTNLSGSKKRPAIVVSNSTVNSSRDLILAQITTTPIAGKLACKISNKDVTKPFDPPLREMYIACKKVAVIEKTLIIKKLTKISDSKLIETIDKVIQIFIKED